MTTREDYFNQDIINRLKGAISEIVNEHGPDPHDVIVFQDGGIGIHISDVMHDAIVEIKRNRKFIEEYIEKTHEIINEISDICNTTFIFEEMDKDQIAEVFYETLAKIDATAKYSEDK